MSKDTFEMPFDEEANSVEEFKNAIFNVFKGLVIEKVKDIVPSFVEKDCDYNVIDSYHEVVDENPELVENLDEFIDGFEYESFEEGEEVYLDENYDSPLEEEYTDDDFEELSDAQLEELLVEHGSGEYEEVYFDEEIYLDDEAYPDEEDAIYYDEVPFEETADEPLVEEIYVDHDEEVIYEDVPVEEVYLDENINEVSPEEPVDEVSVDEDADEADGWAEYIEEEFGESIEQSEDENKQD